MASLAEHTSPYRSLSAKEAASLIRTVPELRIFDVRDLPSYQQAHLSDAMHLAEARVGMWLERLESTQPILFYCYHGNTSKTMALRFAEAGFTQLFSVTEGYRPLARALETAGAPLEISNNLRLFLTEWHYAGDDLDESVAHGITPLMRASLVGRLDIVEELLACHVDIHALNDDGNTALWLACVSRQIPLVKALIDAGIELDHRNLMGATAMMYTASSDRPEILALLLQAGADPLVRNHDELRAVDLAASRECLRLLRHTAD